MKSENLKESFSETLDSAKWSIANIAAVNGRGVLTIAGSGQCELKSIADYDVSDSVFGAKLTPTTLSPGTQAQVAALEIATIGPYNADQFGNESVRIQVSAAYFNETQWRVNIAMSRTDFFGPAPSFVNIPYNPTAHAYIRMRFSGEDVFMETSPDGKTWTNQGGIKHRLSTLTVKPRVFYFNGEGYPAYVDDINIIPSSGAFFQLFG